MPSAGAEHILNAVQNRTSADPDGLQNNQSALWTSRNRIRGDGSKGHTPYERDEVDEVVNQLADEGELIVWHGLLAPACPEHLRAIIENEQQADYPRRILIGRVNRLLQEGESDE